MTITPPQEQEKASEEQSHLWSQHLQRRIMRLLLQHDEPLFRSQFRHFFVNSALPQIPLLQQYDRYMRLRILSSELLDDILPRIRRQLSLKTSHARLHEEAPTRGDIDWQRTSERSWSDTPGLPPLKFDTRLRRRTLDVPENLLTVAILLTYRQEVQSMLKENLGDEELDIQERQVLASHDARAERELSAPYARHLLNQARHVDVDGLIQQVARQLRPGPNPYRDLLTWWQRFTQFRSGHADEQRMQALASRRDDEKRDAWLYELWIALECIHLFAREGAVQVQEIKIATDALQCTFEWKHQRLRFIYNRQLDTSTTYESDWEAGPATRPDYTIERAQPREIWHRDELIWREPPFVLDAKYYLSGPDPSHTHGPLKKLLGDMTLLHAHTGALFFPQLPEPEGTEQVTRVLRRTGKHYIQGSITQSVHLYHLEPTMALPDLQRRLRAVLDLAVDVLPPRPAPICEGVFLDTDTINSSQSPGPANTILCRKRHIGSDVFDLVNVNTDCLQNPYRCHIMGNEGQSIIAPFVIRATDQEQLARQSRTLRARTDEHLRHAENQGDEARAEQLRELLFAGIGSATEHYVKLFGDTRSIEESFERWVFGEHWKRHPDSLSEAARNSLISGEYVWQNSQGVDVPDWAAPAIQYCRALECEIKQRFYAPCPQRYNLTGAGFTLGTIIAAYERRDTNWQVCCQRVTASGSNLRAFVNIMQRMSDEGIKHKRNTIAHGEAITHELAAELRESIIGGRNSPGILHWFVEHIKVR